MAESRDAVRVKAPAEPSPAPPPDVLDANGFRVDAHAVVIGINDYQDPRIPPLRYAGADAQSMYDVLVDPTVGRFKPENVTLLLNEQASYKRIKSEIGTRLPNRTDENSTVCVYFAGHGAPYVDARNKSRDGMEKYLIPYDADAEDLRASGLSMEALQDYFGYITSRQLIFFLDCCYSGGAGGGRSFDIPGIKTRATLNADFLESLSNDARFIVTACGMNEVSLETTEIGHGLFTYFLVEGLKGKADADGDGLVTMDELYSFVCDNVERESKKLGGRMRPMRAGKASGDVYLTQYETEAARRTKEANSKAAAAFDAGDLETARRLWEECVALSPGHERATTGLAVIASREQEAQAEKQELMAARQSTLVKLRRSQALSVEEYAQAVELLESDTDSLSMHLQELYAFAEALADGRITASQYLKSVQYARATATPSQMAMPQPAVAKQMAAERRAARVSTGAVETVKDTGLPMVSMTPPAALPGSAVSSVPSNAASTPQVNPPLAEAPSVAKPNLGEHHDDAGIQNAGVTTHKSATVAAPFLSTFTPPDKPTVVPTKEAAPVAAQRQDASAGDPRAILLRAFLGALLERRRQLDASVGDARVVETKAGMGGPVSFGIGLAAGTAFISAFYAERQLILGLYGLSAAVALYVGTRSERRTVIRNCALTGLGWSIATIGISIAKGDEPPASMIPVITGLAAAASVLLGRIGHWLTHRGSSQPAAKAPRKRS